MDVAITDGGITAITTAYLFKKAGYTVGLIKRGHFGGFDTANTIPPPYFRVGTRDYIVWLPNGARNVQGGLG